MMTTRRVLLQGLAGATILSAAGPLSLTAARAADFKMKLTTTATHDLDTEWLRLLKQNVEKQTANRIVCEVYPASQLGSASATVEGVAMGTIEVAINASGVYEGLNGRFATLSVPGLFRNMTQGAKIFSDTEVRKMFASIGAGKGYEFLTALPHSPTAIVSRKPIRTLEDFKGLKIRVPGSKILVEILKKLGASPVSMSLGEVLPAFQVGTIDGIYLGSTIATALKLHDITKHMTLMPSSFIVIVGLISSDFLKTIGPDLSQKVFAAAAESDGPALVWGENDVSASQKDWEKAGGETIVFSEADAQRFLSVAGPAAVGALSPAARADYEVLKTVAARYAS